MIAFQSCLVLRTVARHLSGDLVLTVVWTPVDRMSEDLVEDDSQVLVRVCGSSPIYGNRGLRQTVQQGC